MPELPEVETIRRGLKEYIVKPKGGKVIGLEILEKKSFIGDPERIIGAEIINLRRRGKAMIVDFANEESILVHLRMTGQLIYRKNREEQKKMPDFAGGHPNENFVAELPNRQTRVVIEFEEGRLFFNDQRKFGFMKVFRTEEIEQDKFIKKLGKEPWEMEADELYEKMQRHKETSVKAVLLNQEMIAGLGNIYADEALYFAKINPARKAGTISLAEAKRILEGARVVMGRSLEAGGSTLKNYVKSDGTRGDYLELFAEVFNRQGEKCKRCGGIIEKTKVAGRGTHVCLGCQK